MTKKFEEMPTDVQESILRAIEVKLGQARVEDADMIVDAITSAYSRLFPSGDSKVVGDISVDVVINTHVGRSGDGIKR